MATSRRRRWKSVERAIARFLGGEREPVSGRQRGYGPDVSHEALAIECKSWARLPERVREALERAAQWAARRGEPGKLPIAVIHGVRSPMGRALVVMRLEEFVEQFGEQLGCTAGIDEEVA
jgi:hypothetical protein